MRLRLRRYNSGAERFCEHETIYDTAENGAEAERSAQGDAVQHSPCSRPCNADSFWFRSGFGGRGDTMTHMETIKSGFRLVHRNWQLVAVQAGMMIANLTGFLVIVGIPLGIAFIIFGLDLTGLAETRDLIGIFRHPSDLISKYMGLVLIVVTSFLLYLLIVTTAGLYVFAGSIGMIGRAVIDPVRRFSMKDFFAAAKQYFFPLMWFSLFVGLIFIVIAFLFGLLGGGAASLVQSAKSQDSTLALFLGIFFSLVLVLAALIIILGVIAVTVYGMAVLFFTTKGALPSFRHAFRFLWDRPSAFWFYVLLFFFYLAANFILMLFTYPFKLIPFIGTIISFPLQLVSLVVQSYIGLAIIAAIFIYYYEAEIKKAALPPEAAGPAAGAQATVESSSVSEDISDEGAARHGATPPAKGPNEET